jgi:LysM repeat protein
LIHRVKPSETIWHLSKEYNVSVEAIYKANRLKPGTVIEVGQELLIPAYSYSPSYSYPSTSVALDSSDIISPPSVSRVREPRTLITPLQVPIHSRRTIHEVGPLETVWRISRMYDVPEKQIYKANRMRPGRPISIGQKLVIPNARVFHNVIPLYPNSRWRYILVHHTATDRGNACLINRSHYGRGWWHGLGYHFLIDNGTMGKGDGQIEASPRWIKQQNGAHCKAGGMNTKAIGICLVGNFSQELPTKKQLQSLIYLTQTLNQGYSIRSTKVLPHRAVRGARTECPGNRFPWSTVQRYV